MSVDEGPAFVDTNVFVYALASDDPRRSPIAERLVNRLMQADMLHTSTQVLQELYVTLTRKTTPAFSPERAKAWPGSPHGRSRRSTIRQSVGRSTFRPSDAFRSGTH